MQKENFLKKHITIKYEEHSCKECKEKLSSFTELIKHIAKYHCKDQGKVESEDDANLRKRDALGKEKVHNASSFVCSESMLDEFH